MADTPTAVIKEGFFGLKNAHIAWLEADGTYAAPIAVPGIRALKMKAEGSKEKKYADDNVYATLYSNQGFDGEAVFYNVADAIVAKMLGYEIDTNGAVVGITDGIPAHFALISEEQAISGNPKRTVYYDCSISRPDNEAATKEDKVDLKEQTYSITAVPVTIGGKTLDHSTLQKSTKNEAVFSTFFTKVYLPGQTAA